MKYIVSVVCIIFVVSVSAQSRDVSAIREVLEAQALAWNNGDMEGYMKGYWVSDELSFVGKRGVSKGWNTVYENYKKNYSGKEAMGRLTFDQLTFDRLGPRCYSVTGAWHLERQEPAGGWFTLIVKKIKKEWKIVYDHTS